MLGQQSVKVAKRAALTNWQIWLIALVWLGLLGITFLLPGASLLDRLRWLDSGICAQLLTHSFYPAGERLPLCARNTGIYLSFMLTLMIQYLRGRGRAQQIPRWPIVVLLGSGILLLAIDGLNSMAVDLHTFHLYQPNNLLRLASGLLTGTGLVLLALPILNQLFWREYNQQRSVASWRELLLFVPGIVLCFGLCATQFAPSLYPVALLSTAGILSALGSVNLIFLVSLSRRQEIFARYRELLPFFALAVLLAVGEMLVLAQLKFMLLGVLGM